MPNTREYPKGIRGGETGGPLRRGVKLLAINVDGHIFGTRAKAGIRRKLY